MAAPGRLELEVDPVALMNPASPIMVSPTGSLLTAPYVNPEPSYISAKEAAVIITQQVLAEFHQLDEVDSAQMAESSLSQISPSAITTVNAFLDRILLNILSNARSLSLVALRPAVRDVLRPKLAQEAIAGADEELIECIGEDDDVDLFEDAQETPDSSWDLDVAWKRARLRCMVYTRLGYMEEEDEDRYLAENGLDNYDEQQMPRDSSMVSPPVAIWLTAILEYVGENVLIVASNAAYKRCESKYGRGIQGKALHASIVLVGDNDLEKIALHPVLGRLWRAWRKPIRSPKTSISRALSIDSMRHRRMDSRSSTGFTKKASSETLNSLRPGAGSQRGSMLKESPIVLDPAAIALPMTDDDVKEIEIPWYNAGARGASRPTSIIIPKNEYVEMVLQKEAEAIEEAHEAKDDTEEAGANEEGDKEGDKEDMIEGDEDQEEGEDEGEGEGKETVEDEEKFVEAESEHNEPQVVRVLRRMRSSSLPTSPSARWDYQLLTPNAFEAAYAKQVESLSKDSSDSEALSGTLTDPTELIVPAVLPQDEKGLSVSQKRGASKRLSSRSAADRKSQVSDVSESGGPVLFSNSDYNVDHQESQRGAPGNASMPTTNVVAPTPISEQMPLPERSEKRNKRLSTQAMPGSRSARSSVRTSGEISPVEPSDDEGSESIAGLRDAQQYISVPKDEGKTRQRPISMERSVSPVNDMYNDAAPVSPMSPEEPGQDKNWPDMSSAEVSPVEARRRSMLPPPSKMAAALTQAPPVAPAPVSVPSQPPAPLSTQHARGASSTTERYSTGSAQAGQQGRIVQSAARPESEERRREAKAMSSDHTKKEMPDLPKKAQVDMLAAAAAAHANVAVPQPDSLYKSISQKPGVAQGESSTAAERQPRDSSSLAPTAASSAPRAPPKDLSPASLHRQAVKPRDAGMYAPVATDSVITSVTPAPAAPVASAAMAPPEKTRTQVGHAPPPMSTTYGPTTVTIHRQEVNQERDTKPAPGPSPLQLTSSPSPSPPATSKLLERRRQLPQVDTVTPQTDVVTPERAAVQRLSPSPSSANDPSKQLPPRSIPETVHSTAPTNATAKRHPGSRNQSRSGDDVYNAVHHEKAKEFNQLIDSGETLQYTLTPQRLGTPSTQDEKRVQDGQSKQANERRHGYSASAGESRGKPRSNSTFAGFPVKIPLGAIRSGMLSNFTFKSGLAPRDPKTKSESTRDLVEFMRTTGPPSESSGTTLGRSSGSMRMSASMTSMRANKRGPQPVSAQNLGPKPTTASMPSDRVGSSGGRLSSNKPKLVARDAQASNSGVSDLISFIRDESPKGPTSAAPNGANRVTSGASYGGSMNSTQESFKTGSVNSYSGLLSNAAGGRVSGGYMGGGSSEEPMMPKRKSRKPRDPYALDDDDDILEEEDEQEGGGNEESLADFLNSQGRVGGGLNSHPPRVSSTGTPSNNSSTTGAAAARGQKVSSIGRPIGPGGIPSRASLTARSASSGGSNTLDLADFFKNSGPPGGTISRIDEDDPREKRAMNKGFTVGRKQRAL